MPSLQEIETQIRNGQVVLDTIRRKTIGELSQLTGRNVIAYYSGFLTRQGGGMEINDMDTNGFMSVVCGMDRKKGLDLILHTPGGGIAATEHLVNYLRDLFDGDIRCVIPQMAMSAGTMIACASREILMGRQSCLGPIDPQYLGVPCHGVVEEFERAANEIERSQSRLGIWRPIIEKYNPTFIGECQKAIDLSEELVKKWLISGMFQGDPNAGAKARNVVKKLGNHANTKTHDRHISAREAIRIGLKVSMIEQDQCLQDVILGLHHCYMLTFNRVKVIKLFESSHGRCFSFNG